MGYSLARLRDMIAYRASLLRGAIAGMELRSRNARFMKRGSPDGLPFPPLQLMYLVTGSYDVQLYYERGKANADSIRSLLRKNGLSIEAFESVLDFGCGAGRLIGYWRAPGGPKLYGSDYNPLMIDWCRKALPFAEFALNGAASRLDFEDEKFDFVYAISVFTHLDRGSQDFWIGELTRVLKPGGYLLITVHGTTYLDNLSPQQRQAFASGQLVVIGESYSGTNQCGTYHPEAYIREQLSRGFTIVDFVPGGAKGSNQDAVLLRKPRPILHARPQAGGPAPAFQDSGRPHSLR